MPSTPPWPGTRAGGEVGGGGGGGGGDGDVCCCREQGGPAPHDGDHAPHRQDNWLLEKSRPVSQQENLIKTLIFTNVFIYLI